MHRDRTVARILLILSVVHLAVATPAIVRQRSLDVDDDVTPASEKRANPEDMPQGSSSVPQMDNESPTTSGAPHLDNGPPPALGTPHLDNDPQSASGAQNLHNDVPPALGTSQPHDDPLTASGTSPVEAPPPRPSPETSQVLSDAKNHKVKFLAGVGIATVFATIAFEFYAVHKYFKDQSYVSAFFPPSPADSDI